MKRTTIAMALALLASPGVSAHEACGCPDDAAPYDWKARWFTGLSLGQTTFGTWTFTDDVNDGSFASSGLDDGGAGYRVFAGLDFANYFGAELGYADFGEATFQAQSDGSGSFWNAGPVQDRLELVGVDFSLLGKVPLFAGTWLVGQVGALYSEGQWVSQFSIQSFGPFYEAGKDRGIAPVYGARIEYDGLRSLRLSAGYLATEIANHRLSRDGDANTELRTLSVSAAWLF
jgi:hypothetical protein